MTVYMAVKQHNLQQNTQHTMLSAIRSNTTELSFRVRHVVVDIVFYRGFMMYLICELIFETWYHARVVYIVLRYTDLTVWYALFAIPKNQ